MSRHEKQIEVQHTPVRILIVEDEADVRAGLQHLFERKGYRVTAVADGETALERLRQASGFDVVLLDLTLPKKSGLHVLREAQRLKTSSAIVVLTVRSGQEEVLKNFSLKADDYVSKPVDADDLTARIRSVVARNGPTGTALTDCYILGDLEINFDAQEAWRGRKKVHLTPLEFDLLRYLVQQRGRILSRVQFLHSVWGFEQDVAPQIGTRTIDRHIAALRKKLEPDPGRPTYIETVYGVGYRFTGELVRARSSVHAA